MQIRIFVGDYNDSTCHEATERDSVCCGGATHPNKRLERVVLSRMNGRQPPTPDCTTAWAAADMQQDGAHNWLGDNECSGRP